MIGFANYGLAIVFITILVKIVLYPLTNTQMKSMKNMQVLQPKLKEIQIRYKDTPEKMQAETMKLYKETGFNPLGGCLPLLVQMPILLAFYQALIKFEYVVPAHASFLWIPNLSAPDPFYVLPILAGVTTFYQQRISTVDSSDSTQRTMMMVMPFFIAWMATKFASGLALYWVMFNLLSILQQMYINYRHQAAPLAGLSSTGAGEIIIEENIKEEAITKDIVVPDGKDKGGKTNAKHRKKGKKRR
ncbi:MAG: membrane protein insertase YidC [Syntrophomonadaceae bacterium]|nr:membrane protein insertase YidC [Syntrophomonadaceae bacterium]